MSAIIALDGHNGQIISLFEHGGVRPCLSGWYGAPVRGTALVHKSLKALLGETEHRRLQDRSLRLADKQPQIAPLLAARFA